MSYQVIARKWRPKDFSELVGQSHIAQTIANALKNNRLPHALLFTGPRGTGKTSSARILAKSLRCENLGPNSMPCNQCSSCLEINQGFSVDVIEIDGASNNGVDAIRELRDGVGYMPSRGKYKVYIIDEVHMLSTSAFNALLKTLEEPPAHVIFVLATTEVHKIPNTILSRCQRFDFRRIPTRQIVERLSYICAQDGIAFDPEALWIIAKQADGSMRDSQSLLDQVISFSMSQKSDKLTGTGTIDVLGLTHRHVLFETLVAIVQQSQEQMFDVLAKAQTSGFDVGIFLKELLEQIRHLLFIKIMPAERVRELVDLPDSEVLDLQKLTQQVSEPDIHKLFDMTLKSIGDLNRSADPYLSFEMALMRLVHAPKIADLESLFKGLASGGVSMSTTNTSAISSSSTASSSATNKMPQDFIQHQSAGKEAALSSLSTSEPVIATAASFQEPVVHIPGSGPETWIQIVAHIKGKDARLGASLENLKLVSYTSSELRLVLPKSMKFLEKQVTSKDFTEQVHLAVSQLSGSPVSVSVGMEMAQTKSSASGSTSVGAAAESVSARQLIQQQESARDQEIRTQVENHPLVKETKKIFNANIESIKEINL